ncbi:hypothetical protein AcW1_002675 [Taiwanofungus camphoratus]|nr:hypothetical protein AcW1_002675 [Antrodia cinnamomea]
MMISSRELTLFAVGAGQNQVFVLSRQSSMSPVLPNVLDAEFVFDAYNVRYTTSRGLEVPLRSGVKPGIKHTTALQCWKRSSLWLKISHYQVDSSMAVSCLDTVNTVPATPFVMDVRVTLRAIAVHFDLPGKRLRWGNGRCTYWNSIVSLYADQTYERQPWLKFTTTKSAQSAHATY